MTTARTRYKELAAKAQWKMDILTAKMAEINENNEKRRKQAEEVKYIKNFEK
jgi:hypothetical protein